MAPIDSREDRGRLGPRQNVGVRGCSAQPLDGLIHLGREYAIAIVQQVRVPLLASHRLSQLLPRPLRSRMRRHVKVNQSTAVMFDDDEHIQDSKRAVTATQKSQAMIARA